MNGSAYNPGPDSWEPDYSDARRQFVATVDERIGRIEAMSQFLGQAPGTKAVMQRIVDEAHKISGVAATLGFVELGEAAAQGEILLRRALDGSVAPAAGWNAAKPFIDEMLDRLEAIVTGA